MASGEMFRQHLSKHSGVIPDISVLQSSVKPLKTHFCSDDLDCLQSECPRPPQQTSAMVDQRFMV